MRTCYRGFSLIELMVVIAITALLIALAAPSFTESTARRRIEGVAAELATDFQYAKSQASSQNTSVSLITAANGYTIGGIPPKAVNLDASTTLTSSVTVTFEPHRSFPAASASVDVSHAQTTSTLRVTVDAVGKVATCSPGGRFPGYVTCI